MPTFRRISSSKATSARYCRWVKSWLRSSETSAPQKKPRCTGDARTGTGAVHSLCTHPQNDKRPEGRKSLQCPGRDSNPHGLRLRILSPMCLPISPPGRVAPYMYPENGAPIAPGGPHRTIPPPAPEGGECSRRPGRAGCTPRNRQRRRLPPLRSPRGWYRW
jgi:hypothetical protein